jgi:Helix-turn-helix domain
VTSTLTPSTNLPSRIKCKMRYRRTRARVRAGGSPAKGDHAHACPPRESLWPPPLGAIGSQCRVRVAAYARSWSARQRRPGKHKGPITRDFLDVLHALLWGFHNSRDGRCFPSYETIAERAECARSTVAEALKALEWAGVLTWQHRITRIRERCTDLFGGDGGWRWRVIRTSNSYIFSGPRATDRRGIPSKSENPAGTQDKRFLILYSSRALHLTAHWSAP